MRWLLRLAGILLMVSGIGCSALAWFDAGIDLIPLGNPATFTPVEAQTRFMNLTALVGLGLVLLSNLSLRRMFSSLRKAGHQQKSSKRTGYATSRGYEKSDERDSYRTQDSDDEARERHERLGWRMKEKRDREAEYQELVESRREEREEREERKQDEWDRYSEEQEQKRIDDFYDDHYHRYDHKLKDDEDD